MAGSSSSGGAVKRRLGRGLSTLISSPAPIAPPPAADSAVETKPIGDSLANADSLHATTDRAPASDNITMIPVGDIVPNRRQPRQDFDEDALSRLSDSIRKAGLMQPIVVRPLVDSPGEYELIAGERRWRAVQRLSMPTIPAIVRTVDDREAAEWALIENLQREDLNPMDRAAAFARLIDDFSLSHQEIADEVGLDRSTISNLLRLNELDAVTSAAVRAGHLSLGHAKALLGCTDSSARGALATAAIRHGWSVRKTESEVRRLAHSVSDNTRRTASDAVKSGGSAHLDRLQDQLGALLGTKVHIEPSKAKGAGRLVIEYYSFEQFEGILERTNLAGALANTSN